MRPPFRLSGKAQAPFPARDGYIDDWNKPAASALRLSESRSADVPMPGTSPSHSTPLGLNFGYLESSWRPPFRRERKALAAGSFWPWKGSARIDSRDSFHTLPIP